MKCSLSLISLIALLVCNVVAQNPPPQFKEANPNSWREFKSVEGRFTVSLPGPSRPAHDDRTMNTRIGKIVTHSFIIDTDMALYYVSYADFPAGTGPTTPEENKSMLDTSRDEALAGGARLLSESDVSIGGTTARELLVAKNDLILRSRFFYVNERLYQLIMTVKPIVAFRNGKPSSNATDRTELFEKASARFFDSFNLTK